MKWSRIWPVTSQQLEQFFFSSFAMMTWRSHIENGSSSVAIAWGKMDQYIHVWNLEVGNMLKITRNLRRWRLRQWRCSFPGWCDRVSHLANGHWQWAAGCSSGFEGILNMLQKKSKRYKKAVRCPTQIQRQPFEIGMSWFACLMRFVPPKTLHICRFPICELLFPSRLAFSQFPRQRWAPVTHSFASSWVPHQMCECENLLLGR